VKRPADVIGNAVSVMRIATVFYNFVRMHKTGPCGSRHIANKGPEPRKAASVKDELSLGL
jgi:hypothetical protein